MGRPQYYVATATTPCILSHAEQYHMLAHAGIPLVLSALMKKRAEIDGDLRQAAKRIAELRADRDTIDAAIRVFDPTRLPHKIKPHLRRPKPKLFRHGGCSRAIMGMLRTAPGAITRCTPWTGFFLSITWTLPSPPTGRL